jgi:hypothetical protein
VLAVAAVTTATMIFHILTLRRLLSAASTSQRGFLGSMRKRLHGTCLAPHARASGLVAIDEAHQVPICPG